MKEDNKNLLIILWNPQPLDRFLGGGWMDDDLHLNMGYILVITNSPPLKLPEKKLPPRKRKIAAFFGVPPRKRKIAAFFGVFIFLPGIYFLRGYNNNKNKNYA